MSERMGVNNNELDVKELHYVLSLINMIAVC